MGARRVSQEAPEFADRRRPPVAPAVGELPLGGLEQAGNRALAALLASRAISTGGAVQRSPLDELFSSAAGEPATEGQDRPEATTTVAESENRGAPGASTPGGATVIESADSNGRPTKTEVRGKVSFEPPLDRPAVVVRPDGSKTVLLPDASGGIRVIQPDGTSVVVKGKVEFSPEDGKVPGGGGDGGAVETGAQAGWLDQPALSFASRGEKVRELQDLLNRSGAQPPLAADGEFGPGTLAAVKRFQARAGLVPDGVVGPKTWEALGGTGELPSIRSQQVHPVPATGGV